MRSETRAGSSFTFGPYPTEDRLAALERDGYTAVISLLHPAVVPFEPKLIADETAAAERVGIEFIHLPMLPWIADNTVNFLGAYRAYSSDSRFDGDFSPYNAVLAFNDDRFQLTVAPFTGKLTVERLE